ncbi:MAG: acetylhydrolase [Candidatus Aminicenantes bacterium]|nr:acetylhydrolase [Candidatus Aminicenantes bacterium]
MFRKKIHQKTILGFVGFSVAVFSVALAYFLWLTAGVALSAGSRAEALFNAEPGDKFEVKVLREVWLDTNRQRQIPVKIYYPAEKKEPAAVIVFSHGLAGSREGYEYLGRFWAENGLISVHLQHVGSDEEVWKGKKQPLAEMKKAAANGMNAVERARDVSFCLDRLGTLNLEEGPLKGLIHMDRIGLAGHSFGAHTTLLLAGQLIILPQGRELSFADKRIKAAIPMSAPVPANRKNLDKIYSRVRIPCLHLTGTLDDSPIGETRAEDRRFPFDHINGSDQYLAIFNGGDHMIFSGRPPLAHSAGRGQKDQEFQDLIKKLSLAFWRAYLLGESEAEKWLKEGGAEKMLGDLALFELKNTAKKESIKLIN